MFSIRDAILGIKEHLRNAGSLVDSTLVVLAEEFTKVLNVLLCGAENPEQQLPKNMKVYEVEVVTKDKIVEIAKECMFPNCNEVVAMKKNGKDYDSIIYLAYSKDRELLPQEKNFYVIINAKEITKSVDELFGEKELIILN